ncbi:MAG: hypothetical protein AAGG08_13255, partial [Actinomycetota bacterium]
MSKPVNLVAFTPGTSFDHGGAWGQRRERALIARIIEDIERPTESEWRRLKLVLRGNAFKGFDWELDSVLRSWDSHGINEQILDDFSTAIRSDGSLQELRQLIDDIGRRRTLDDQLTDRARDLCSRFRRTLARSSVNALEPDLVILDEFQRFRSLLDPDSGPTAELAHDLFDHPDAHVLLLSATPYKPFTLAAEREGEQDEEHYRDLIATLGFLAGGDRPAIEAIERDLGEFRRTVSGGQVPGGLPERIGEQLRELMVRTERPPTLIDAMTRSVPHEPGIARSDDLLEHVGLRNLANELEEPLPVDYWKSIPQFANHLDGYAIGGELIDQLDDPSRAARLSSHLGHLRAVTHRDEPGPVIPGNARFNALSADVLDAGLWRLPWLPPSLPYTAPGGAWADPAVAGATKRLIFSNWSAVPAAVTTLLSHNARWLATGGRTVHDRLQYNVSDGRPNGMNAFALFWPHPTLAAAIDPLEVRRRSDTTVSTKDVIGAGAESIRGLASIEQGHAARQSEWESYAGLAGALPDGHAGNERRAVMAMLGIADASEFDGAKHDGADRHHDRFIAAASSIGRVANRHVEPLARLAAFGPANTAWRALTSIIRPEDDVASFTLWSAAAIVADGLRSLFNRYEIACLLDDDARFDSDMPYWQRVLQTCADGNLQAVLEEYLAHLRPPNASSFVEGDPAETHGLIEIAQQVRAALALRESTLRLFDPTRPEQSLGRPTRFAVRYGGKIDRDDDASARLGEVRSAFNSPFWPFVLASTSVGQEGIDFHWW